MSLVQRAGGLALLLLLLPAGGCGAEPFAEGVEAYRDGRPADALEAFARAEALAGDAAGTALLHDRALAALRVGRARDAEISAEKLVARGGPGEAGFRSFVAGNAAWQRMNRARAEAGLTDPDPTAFARAIEHAEAARDAWLEALDARADWAAARRNVERAQRALEELQRQQAEAEAARRNKKQGTAEQPAREPEPDPDAPPEEVEQAAVLQQDDGALTADQLDALVERLGRKEQEKRALRQRQQVVRRTAGERDW
jgi:hypothetical protein